MTPKPRNILTLTETLTTRYQAQQIADANPGVDTEVARAEAQQLTPELLRVRPPAMPIPPAPATPSG